MKRDLALVIDGATYTGSVAVLRGAAVVAERTIAAGGNGTSGAGRTDRLMPAVAECLAEARADRGSIARVICGAGPGSFTSLRVAGSVAKGLAVGYGVDLYDVSSLLLTVTGTLPPLPAGEYLSVLDAMRGEWYVARVVVREGSIEQIEPPRLLSDEALDHLSREEPSVRVIGPGRAIDARPHARGAGPVMEEIVRRGPVDLHAWEPNYGRLAEAQVRWEAAHGRPLQA